MSMELNIYIICFYILELYFGVAGEFCLEHGHSCSSPYRCCQKTCCLPDGYEDRERYHLRWSIWNMWYFWFFVIFILMLCFGGCGYWRRRQILVAQQHALIQTRQLGLASLRHCHQATLSLPVYAAEPENPVPQPQGSFPSPPPYAEVISKEETDWKGYKDLLPPYPGGPILLPNDTPQLAYALKKWTCQVKDIPRRNIGASLTEETQDTSLPPYTQVGADAPPPYQTPPLAHSEPHPVVAVAESTGQLNGSPSSESAGQAQSQNTENRSVSVPVSSDGQNNQ